MKARLKFLGAAQNVTGSRHFLEVDGTKVLVDCGLYQERQFQSRNWEPFSVPASEIDAVLLTHAHLDHCGLLPKLVKDGFKGKIYGTEATGELAKIILMDSAKLQEEDAEFKRKRHKKEGRVPPFPDEPLYTIKDVEVCCPLFTPVKYGEVVKINEHLEVTFHNAGHVLGASIIRAKVDLDGRQRIILFSGDMGRPDRPIVNNAEVFTNADYVLIESTYGDRVHDEKDTVKEEIAKTINAAVKAKGKIVIPSFALERAQDILYYLNQLYIEKLVPRLPIYFDSPMASKITKVFKKHPELFDEEMQEYVNGHHSPFEMPELKFAGTKEESKAINNIKGPVIIIAGSGMCTGGRIKHHLINAIVEPQNTIMFVGYQAAGTLGRQIVDGEKEVRILGTMYKVKATVTRVRGFSAHADKNELLAWLQKLHNEPKNIFVVHGELEAATSFSQFIKAQTGWSVTVPAIDDEYILS
jgi:metallo-beta-lactamase family protein